MSQREPHPFPGVEKDVPELAYDGRIPVAVGPVETDARGAVQFLRAGARRRGIVHPPDGQVVAVEKPRQEMQRVAPRCRVEAHRVRMDVEQPESLARSGHGLFRGARRDRSSRHRHRSVCWVGFSRWHDRGSRGMQAVVHERRLRATVSRRRGCRVAGANGVPPSAGAGGIDAPRPVLA